MGDLCAESRKGLLYLNAICTYLKWILARYMAFFGNPHCDIKDLRVATLANRFITTLSQSAIIVQWMVTRGTNNLAITDFPT